MKAACDFGSGSFFCLGSFGFIDGVGVPCRGVLPVLFNRYNKPDRNVGINRGAVFQRRLPTVALRNDTV